MIMMVTIILIFKTKAEPFNIIYFQSKWTIIKESVFSSSSEVNESFERIDLKDY